MAEPRFADDDDLPRTLRRERDARERELREREAPSAMAESGYGVPTGSGTGYAGGGIGYEYAGPSGAGAVTVTRFRVPFFHLMTFLIKAVFAAVPALIVMALMLWAAGETLRVFVPTFKGIHITISHDRRAATDRPLPEPPRPAPEPKKR
jgi:hypothetical protein